MSINTEYVERLSLNKRDPELGAKVRAHLASLGLENNIPTNYDPVAAVGVLQHGIEGAFAALGVDPSDPSTRDTPRRYACMVVGELTKGLNYDFFPKCTTQPNGTGARKLYTSDETVTLGGYNQAVISKNIETISLCEHHLQTIYGYTHIAYIPKTLVLGLSKFARVTDFFARRPQIQERMTEQIFEALRFILETDDIAVVVDAEHFCMKARGALQNNARTQTNKVGGLFMTNPALRQEFLDAIR